MSFVYLPHLDLHQCGKPPFTEDVTRNREILIICTAFPESIEPKKQKNLLFEDN